MSVGANKCNMQAGRRERATPEGAKEKAEPTGRTYTHKVGRPCVAWALDRSPRRGLSLGLVCTHTHTHTSAHAHTTFTHMLLPLGCLWSSFAWCGPAAHNDVARLQATDHWARGGSRGAGGGGRVHTAQHTRPLLSDEHAHYTPTRNSCSRGIRATNFSRAGAPAQQLKISRPPRACVPPCRPGPGDRAILVRGHSPQSCLHQKRTVVRFSSRMHTKRCTRARACTMQCSQNSAHIICGISDNSTTASKIKFNNTQALSD